MQTNATASTAVGAKGKVRVIVFAVPVALACLPDWSAAIKRSAARG
jgi:hypothetical protein